MRGVTPTLIITDEAANIKNAIDIVLQTSMHRLCMWHIMEKVPENVGPSVREEPEFWKRLNSCVWGSENPYEFESQCNSIIIDFGLEENKWLATRFIIRDTWIPNYIMDVPLVDILRTISRSESANSFFNRFIHRRITFVKFWITFDTTLECQREEDLMADNTSIHTKKQLLTPWRM
jgi:hypothetical protein